MNKKELRVLETLAANQDRRITGSELSAQLGYSPRSIRSYIRNIEGECLRHGARIEARPGSGYQLAVHDRDQFERFLLEQNQTFRPGELPPQIDDVEMRRKWMLDQMLIHEQALETEALASRFYISESTIKKDVQALRQLCEPYALRLCWEKGTLRIQGEEQNKRSLIMEQFHRSSKLSSLQDYLDSSTLFMNLPTSTLLRILLEENRRTSRRLSDIQMQNILLHLALSIRRVMEGKTIAPPALEQVKADSEAWKTASRILKQVSREMNLHFPPSEIHYLAIHFSGLNEGEISREKIEQELDSILQMLVEDEILTASPDPQLREALIEHLIPMIIRVRSNVQMANPMTEEIREISGSLFDTTKKYFSMMPSFRRYTLIDDEWAYLTLHLQAAKERARQKQKLQVLVICASGYGASQLLKSRLVKIFGDDLHIVSEAGYFDMSEETLKGIDLIISSVNIGAVIFGIPFLHVSIFLDTEDQHKIRRYIETHKSRANGTVFKEMPDLRRTRRNAEIFSRYLRKENFLVLDESAEAGRVIEDLIVRISSDEEEGFIQQMKEQIAIRNQMGNVVFSPDIAVAHPAIPLAAKAEFALALIPKGAWWSEKFPRVRMLFLMSPSRYGNEDLNQMTGAIVNLIERRDLQEQILKQATFEAFQKAFLECMEE